MWSIHQSAAATPRGRGRPAPESGAGRLSGTVRAAARPPNGRATDCFRGAERGKTGSERLATRSFPQRRRGRRESDSEGGRGGCRGANRPPAATGRRSPSRTGFQGFEFRVSGERVSIPRPRSADSLRARPANHKSFRARAGGPESAPSAVAGRAGGRAQSTIAIFANTTGWLNPAEIPVAPGDRDRQVRARRRNPGPNRKGDGRPR